MRRLTSEAQPAPRKARRATRWLMHGSVLLASFAVGATALVWPQWLAVDGARSALAVQQEREQEFEDRLVMLRTMNERLRDWQQDGRRVFLRQELTSFERVVQQVARREGSQVAKVQVTTQPSSRWRSVSMRQFAGGDQSDATGEIQPRSVRVVLTGSFDSVYRTVASLTRQQQLFLPERWDIAPAAGGADAGGALRAEVWATVFAVQEPEEKPSAPVNSGPVAANVLLEEVQ